MKIVTFNLRGWGEAGKRRRLKQLILKEDFDVCLLQETKRNSLQPKEIPSIWGRGNCNWVMNNADGRSGGMLCIWKEDIFDVQFLFSGDSYIGLCVKHEDRVFYLVNVYAPCNIEGKIRLWDELISKRIEFGGGEWCIGGDFNAVTNRAERRGASNNSNTAERNAFVQFIDAMEVVEPQVLGKRFTWYSNDEQSMSRLDRFLVTDTLLCRWKITAQWIGNRDISDHCPVWLLKSETGWGPKPFKFNNCWLEHRQFKQFVEDCWSSVEVPDNYPNAIIVKEKLKALKGKLKWWNKEVFGILDINIENVVKELNELEEIAANGGTVNVDQIRALSTEFWQQLRCKENLLAQKSRAKWIAEGDANTRFFHMCINNNRRRTQITRLKQGEEWVEGVGDVKNVAKIYFERRFVEENYRRPLLDGVLFKKVSDEDNKMLAEPFSVEEVKEVIWECDGNKSPGPDGFNLNFYKSCWDVVQRDVMNFLNEFAVTGMVPKAVYASFITLIPKCLNPHRLEEYRPISLIGSLYKILAKVLACRLKKVLGKVISEGQNAFLPGRQILEGAVTVTEVLDLAKRRKKSCLALKVDFEKAYDSVSWSFIDHMLHRLGFDNLWRKWMWGCYSASSMSVLINGSPTDEFTAHRGLKQGDPLAPFLFVVVAEGLAGLIKQAEETGCLKGFPVSNDLSVSLLQFADDTIIFTDGSESNLWGIKAILRSFELASGLKINYAKSNVLGVNIEERVLRGASAFLACCVGSIPFKFLGIQVGANPRRCTTWEPVLNKVKLKLSSWRGKQLSIGGRITLINSVLSSLPLYYFSFYKVPKKVLNELIRLQRAFLWGGDEAHRKIAWVSWKTICLPKSQGGLGIKNLEAFNIALLSKWRWKCLVGGDSLWHQVLLSKYGNLSRWRISHYSMRNASIWWRDISVLGNEFSGDENWFKRVTHLRVGRGDKVLFWKDSWCGTSPFCQLFPDLYDACLNKNDVVQKHGVWNNGMWRWNIIVDGDTTNLNDLQVILRDVTLCWNKDDEWVWSIGNKKQFTVKECYSWLMNFYAGTQFGAEIVAACVKLWKTNVPTKAKVLVWRLFIDRLPTRDALVRRGVITPGAETRCVCCLREEECANHLFFGCNRTKYAWRRILAWAGVADLNETDAVMHFCRFGQQLMGRKLKRLKFVLWIATIWAIWHARNKKIFEGIACNINSIADQSGTIAEILLEDGKPVSVDTPLFVIVP